MATSNVPVSVIALTGGPCGGKSSFLPIAKQWLEDHGLAVAILPETATEVITAGLPPFDGGWPDHFTFQEHLIQYQIEREDRYIAMLSQRSSSKPKVLLCDRGTIDSMAFIGRNGFLEVLARSRLSLPYLRSRYTSVVHLMSAARGAPEFYTLANNAARSETPEQAETLDRAIEAAWLGHPHLTTIDNQTAFADKIRRALAALSRVLHIPEPLEIERKYLVHKYENIPTPHVAVDIEQVYLLSDDGERRLRKRTLDGVSTYFLTEKKETDTPTPGIRIERERELNLGEYERTLHEKDPARNPIHKTRYCFLFAGRHLELDVYQGVHEGLVILEAEVTSLAEEVSLPSWWVLEEVTGTPQYSNAELAYAPNRDRR